MTTFTTIRDLTAHVADVLGVDPDEIEDSVRAHHSGRYEDTTDESLTALVDAVQADIEADLGR